VVERIDTVEHRVYVDRTRDQIKAAPEYDQTVDDAQFRERLGNSTPRRTTVQIPGCDPGAGGQASDACWAASR
jgi:hypothetical protein